MGGPPPLQGLLETPRVTDSAHDHRSGMLVMLSALSSGPPVQTTGAPRLGTFAAERTCSQVNCHIRSPLNSGGQLEILGLPETYVPGTNYPLTIRLASNQSATCGNASNGNFLAGAGDLIYTAGETTQASPVAVERVTWTPQEPYAPAPLSLFLKDQDP